jgi:hypothetical protein
MQSEISDLNFVMNSHSDLDGRPWPTLATVLTLAALVTLVTVPPPAAEEISEPDNILYGTIVIGTNTVTAARSDVVVEARRTPAGPAVASYRMGTNPGLGSFYLLRVPVEAFGPVAHANASLAGETLYIVLRDASGVQGEAAYTIPERGAAHRVNFGVAVPDSDGNGLPDVWEIARLGGTGQNPNADVDGDGQSNMKEWIAGTDPADRNDAFRVTIQETSGQIEVAFVALRAEGPGYEGVTRSYSLQSSTNLGSGLWSSLPGLTDVVGNNQTVQYQSLVSSTNQPLFYRGSVRLQ